MAANPLAWIVSDPYTYPALEMVHIAGIALLVGNLALLEARVWGFGASVRLALRIAWGGFALVAASGLLMVAANPGEMFANPAFRLKLALIAAGGVNAWWFHRRGGIARPDGMARAQTAFSLGLWLAVIMCGRWIAYA